MTGDTVDIDPSLLERVVYTEGENKGKQKSLGDMTEAEKQRYAFQFWWEESGEEIMSLFGIGGKYETTNINFKFSYKPKGFLESIFTDDDYLGKTTWGKQSTSEIDMYEGARDIKPEFGVTKTTFNIYLAPNPLRTSSITPSHEWQHVRLIFNWIQKREIVRRGTIQHYIMDFGRVPNIK